MPPTPECSAVSGAISSAPTGTPEEDSNDCYPQLKPSTTVTAVDPTGTASTGLGARLVKAITNAQTLKDTVEARPQQVPDAVHAKAQFECRGDSSCTSTHGYKQELESCLSRLEAKGGRCSSLI